MSRKHKSNRRRKITQSNVPALHNDTQQVDTVAENETTQPENTTETTATTAAALPDSSETQPNSSLNTDTENTHSGSQNTTDENDSPYSLDAHYDAQEQDKQENQVVHSENAVASSLKAEPDNAVSGSNEAKTTPTENPVASNTATATSLAEYEQLKHKNRRRLVSAGALVLVAGSLFAAASKDNAQKQNDPSLSVVKVASQPVMQPEILRPAGSENKVDLSMDDVPSTAIPLKNNMVATPQERAALAAKQKAATTAKPKTNADNDNTTTKAVKPVAPVQTAAEKAKAREEARLAEERRQRAQSKAAEAEARRQETEREVANKARIAQANADRIRNDERAKLRAQLTVERAAQEKQRAQRQAAERASKSNSGSGGNKAIQAGAFADKESAKRMQQQLRSLNYNARLEEVQTNKGKVYRVRTGDFANDAEAKNALNQMKNKGVNAMVVGK